MDFLADLAEPTLRILAAVTMTTATTLMYRASPRGSHIGQYAVAVVAFVAVWRWLLVGIFFDPSHFGWISPWVQIVNPAIYTLLGVLLTIIGFAGRRRE